MKRKNIVGLIAAMGLMLVSCSKETAIDGSGVMEKPDASFDITLVCGGVETKAAPNGYVPATEEEIKINNCAVAVFEAGGKMVGFKYSTFEKSNTTYDEKEAYKVSDIETRSGNVKVLVVANSPLSEGELKALNTYSAFKTQTVSYDNANSFVASNLIKFGEVPETIGTTAKQDIVVPLTQVAARVDVTYHVTTAEEGWSAQINSNTINGINVSSKVFLSDYDLSSYDFGKFVNGTRSNVAVSDDRLSFYTYETDDPVKIDVPVNISYGTFSQDKTYQLSLLPKYEEGKCSTNGIVHGHYYEVTGNMSIEADLSCTIEWEVKSFDEVKVTIPTFE